MDVLLAFLAYMYPKIQFNQALGLVLAFLLFSSKKLKEGRINLRTLDDSFSAMMIALFLILVLRFGNIPQYVVISSLFVSSFRKRLHYSFSMPIYFLLSFLFLSYISNPWNIPLRILISLTSSLASALILYAYRNENISVPLILTNLIVFTVFDIYRINVSVGELALGFVIAFLLSLVAYRSGVADETGLMSATIVGMLIIVSSDIRFFLALILFYAFGSAVTKYRFKEKELLGVGEPAGGARGFVNVFANSLPALFFTLNYSFFGNRAYSIAFIASLSTALGDTMASEIGKLSEKVYLITNLRRVKAGESGGISAIGEVSAFIGCLIISIYSLLSGILGFQEALIAMIAGFVGVHIDSILGATLEKRGLLDNAGVNFFSTLFSGLLVLLTQM